MNNAIAKDEELDLKERILMAAIDEFGRKGYEAASTNAIVAAAGVSKGLLFHYFGNKKDLFMHCAYQVLHRLSEYMIGSIDLTETDLFDRLKTSITSKIRFLQDYPQMMGMVNRMWFDIPADHAELEEYFVREYGDYTVYRQTVLSENVDRSRFRDDLDGQAVVGYATLILDAGWRRHTDRYADDPAKAIEAADEYLAELDTLFEILKHGAYKE